MLEFFEEEPQVVHEVRKRARDFARTVLRPTANEDDEAAQFRREYFAEAGKRGFMGLIGPKAFGGIEGTHLSYYAMLEEISRESLSMTVTVAVTHLTQNIVNQFGSPEQKQLALAKLISGEWLGAFSLSEPGAGSDAASLKCAAKAVKDGYSITGNKLWCSSAGSADAYILIARTSPDKGRGTSAFLVLKDTPGFRVGKQEKKLGLRASPLAELVFEECFLPTSSRIGQEGDGLKIALAGLDGGRIVIGTAGSGVASSVLDCVLSERKITVPESPFADGIDNTFARHYAQLLAVKALIAQAARLKDMKGPVTTIASALKLLGSDLAMHVTSDAVEFLGERAYTGAFPVERMMRDSKALQIVEGTNQVQQHVLSREMRRMAT